MHVQLWPIGCARVHGLAISYLLCGLMGLSWISLPNFITFEPGVLWAAIDSNGRMVIMIGKRTKTTGVSQLRCLTPKYSCKQQCGAHANGAINGIIDTSNGFQDICKSSHRNPRRLSPDSNRRPSGSQAKSLRTELLSGVSWNGDFCIKREMSKNAILLIIAPPRHQMTPDFFPALGKEPRSMPSNFISINQSVLDINQNGGKSILT